MFELKLQTILIFFFSSFHVGSGCQTPDAYRVALEKAHQVFKYAVCFKMALFIHCRNFYPIGFNRLPFYYS